MANLVPFGKHKGKPVDALLDDREYVDWLTQQGWFREKYGNIYQIVINNGAEPTETPEHNAMQVRFLSEEYRLKVAALAYRSRFIPIFVSGVSFEHSEKYGFDACRNVDVFYSAEVKDTKLERIRSLSIMIEIKPSLGDDFPAVLRQMKQSGARILLVDRYTGIGATFEQVREFFKISNITVITHVDVEAVSLPQIDNANEV